MNLVDYNDSDLVLKAETTNKDDNMTGKVKYDLREKINNLSSTDHINLFKIVYKHNHKKVHTTNNSGTFFDLNDLDNKTLWKVEKFISLVLNKIELDKVLEKQEHEKKITELATKNKPKEKKSDDSLIPRNNKQKAATNNNLYEEIMGGATILPPTSVNSVNSATTTSTSSTSSTATPVTSVLSSFNVSDTSKIQEKDTEKDKEKGKAKITNPIPASGALAMFMNRGTETSGKSASQANVLAKGSEKDVSSAFKFTPANKNSTSVSNSFVGGAICITDDDLNAEIDNNNEIYGPDDDDDDDDDGLEDDEEDDGLEEGDEEEYELDPNQMIRNGGRAYVDDE